MDLNNCRNPLERTLEWHEQQLVLKMEENLSSWNKLGFRANINSTDEEIDKLTKEDFEKIKKIILSNLEKVTSRSKEEDYYGEMGVLLYAKTIKIADKHPSKICPIIRKIASKGAKLYDQGFARHFAGHQVSSYLETYKSIMKWGATSNYYPEYSELLQKKNILQTQTLYVTVKMGAFLDECMMKINQAFFDLYPKLFRKIEEKLDVKLVVHDKKLLEFMNKKDGDEEEFYKKNEKYRFIANFFINEFTKRLGQELDIFVCLKEKGEKITVDKIKKFISGYNLIFIIDQHLETVYNKKEQPFLPYVIRQVLFELCGRVDTKESGIKAKKLAWNLLDEYDKAVS